MSTNETRWTTNESLLQSYRSIFISAHSFLLAVGALIYDTSFLFLIIITSINIAIIGFIWIPVVISRHRIVDYYKYKYLAESKQYDKSQVCLEHDYIHDRKLRRMTNKELDIKKNWRQTRIKMDGILPSIFIVIWVLIILFKIGVLK